MRRSRGMRTGQMLAGAALTPLVVSSSAGAMLAAAVGLAMLILVLVVAVLALGAAFARGDARRRACLVTLQALLPPASRDVGP